MQGFHKRTKTSITAPKNPYSVVSAVFAFVHLLTLLNHSCCLCKIWSELACQQLYHHFRMVLRSNIIGFVPCFLLLLPQMPVQASFPVCAGSTTTLPNVSKAHWDAWASLLRLAKAKCVLLVLTSLLCADALAFFSQCMFLLGVSVTCEPICWLLISVRMLLHVEGALAWLCYFLRFSFGCFPLWLQVFSCCYLLWRNITWMTHT